MLKRSKYCAACGVELDENDSVVCWKCYKVQREYAEAAEFMIKSYRKAICELREEIKRLKRYRDAIMKDPKFARLWAEMTAEKLSK